MVTQQPSGPSLMELCAWKLLSYSPNWESGGPLSDRSSWICRSQLGAKLLLIPLLSGIRRFTPAISDYRCMADAPVRVTSAVIRQLGLFRGACVSRLDVLPSNAVPSLGDEPYVGAQRELLTALLNLTPASLYLYEGLQLVPPIDAYVVHIRRLASLLHTLDVGLHYPDLVRADSKISFNRVVCLRARLLSRQPIADLSLRFICANLVSLDLAGSSLSADQLKMAAIQLPSLRCLGLRRCVTVFLVDCELSIDELRQTYSIDPDVDCLEPQTDREAGGIITICCGFPQLETLDISQPPLETLDEPETVVLPFRESAWHLRQLLERLPRLRRLDVSFTSLANAAPAVAMETSRLEYIGLFGATCQLDGIAAQQVGSDRSLSGFSILLSEMSRDPHAAAIVLRALFQFLRSPSLPSTPENGPGQDLELLQRLLDIMEDFAWAEGLQTLFLQASAAIYYLIRSFLKHAKPASQSVTVCRCLDVIATSIYKWRIETMTRRNFLLSLFMLLNNDMDSALTSYIRVKLLRSLLFVLDSSCAKEEPESIRYVLAVINYLAISFDEPERQFVGCDCRLVHRVLDFIEKRLDAACKPQPADSSAQLTQNLSSAWSILWNITDESEKNCSEFMRHEGLRSLVRCHQEHSVTADPAHELMRNVLGLLGNVSEVPVLAADLLISNPEIPDILRKYLDRWTAENVEAAYNAAGIVAHCLHSRCQPSLTDAEKLLDSKVCSVIRLWPTANLSRQINYRSFQPILRLLRCRRARASYAWGAWALMSMCRHLPEKYVPLLASEGGTAVLEELVGSLDEDFEVISWASETLSMLRRWQDSRGDSQPCGQ